MRFSLVILFVVGILVGVGYWRYSQPLPKVYAQELALEQPSSTAIELPWPAYGQSALGAAGFGVLAVNKTTKPVPIASISKAITALAILQEKPLLPGQKGPVITATEEDVRLYRDYLAKDGSVLPLNAGERATQYELLQAMMLPSANNIADTAAKWAFGSVEAYTSYANKFVKDLGMSETTVADASGFSPRTTSTAKDLVVLGEAVLRNPVLAGIVKQKSAGFPGLDEKIRNVNWLLGTEGILGIKTGNTDQAGGCYLFGVKRQVAGGRSVTVIGAVLGAPTRQIAMNDSLPLIRAADKGFETAMAVRAGQIVGRYNLPWGGSADAVVSSDFKILHWKGSRIEMIPSFKELAVPAAENLIVGSVKVMRPDPLQDANTVPIKLRQAAPPPSWTWRLLR